MADDGKRIALLIDADNAPAGKIDAILAELARHGVANVRRAYGNWKSHRLKGWEDALHAYAIQPIQQFAYSTGKNASDMAMVIDAMDLLYARNLDGFAIVSSDADFTPLVMRLRADSMRVFGFGEDKTPQPFVQACSTLRSLARRRTPARRRRSGPSAAPTCARTRRWCTCCAARCRRPPTTMAGPTSARWAVTCATRAPSTSATTAIATSAA
jgi:uncharacterized LabA/DUF88 family protein